MRATTSSGKSSKVGCRRAGSDCCHEGPKMYELISMKLRVDKAGGLSLLSELSAEFGRAVAADDRSVNGHHG